MRTASTRFGAVLSIALLAVAGFGIGKAAAEPNRDPVAFLINQIATVDQTIADLDDAIAVRQQDVNRTVADYQNALAAQQLATAAAQGAKDLLADTATQVSEAQRQFDALVRSVHRRGNAEGGLANYVSADDPDKVLDRATALDQLSRDQQRTVRNLQVARNQQANRVAATEATERQAASATTNAEQRKTDAVNAVQVARDAMSGEQQRRSGLVEQRTQVQQELDLVRGTPEPHPADPPSGQGPADLLRGLFPDIPGLPSTHPDEDEMLPPEGAPAPEGAPEAAPAPEGAPEAAPDARAEGTHAAFLVAAEAAARLAAHVTQQILAELVGEQQVPQSELLDKLGIGGSGLDDSTGNLSSRLSTGSLGQVFGSSAPPGVVRPGLRGPQAIEVVVNRALSQLNVQYAWGGGDASGPTLGIRDGGVADSYGDYNKIGFDCSGLMVYAFAGVGIDLPKYSGYQYTSGPQVPLADIQRGDMIFYGSNASQHVALYLGDGKMVEAPSSGDVVKVSPLRTAGAMPNVVRML